MPDIEPRNIRSRAVNLRHYAIEAAVIFVKVSSVILLHFSVETRLQLCWPWLH